MNKKQLNSLNSTEICSSDKMQDVSSNNTSSTHHPWSLLGVSKNDIDSVLNDNLFDPNNDVNASTNKAQNEPKNTKVLKTSKKKKPIVRNSSKLHYKSKRKLPLTVRPKASVSPAITTAQVHRKSSMCSTKSIDTDNCDTLSLPSITSSSSYLNDINNPKSTADVERNICTMDTSDTTVKHVVNEDAKVKSEASITQASLKDDIPVFNDDKGNNSNKNHNTCGVSMGDTPRTLPTLTATSSGLTTHHSNVYQHELYESQQDSYCQQQSYIPCHQNNNDSIYGNLVELQLQYQRSIQRITNSMRQSHQTTRYIVQLQEQNVQQRRRSSIFASQQQQNHHSYRRRSSLFCHMTDKTINIPITEISESTRHDKNKEIKATNTSDIDIGNGNTFASNNNNNDNNKTNTKLKNENENDESSTTSSCNTSVTSNVVLNPNNNNNYYYHYDHYHRRRSSINFTNMNRKLSITHQPSRRTSSLSMYSHTNNIDNNNVNINHNNNNAQMTNPNILPSHHNNHQQQQFHHHHQHMQQVQHSPSFIISSNVEQSRQILYDILHSKNHMNDFMMM